MRLAVTGARGRLAPGMVDHLAACGHQVIGFSRKAGDGLDDLSLLAQEEVQATFDAVLHLGWSSVPFVSEQAHGIEELQDLPFARSLASATMRCPKPPKIIFFSSAAVYGNTGGNAATELSPCRPLGRYAAAKLDAERILSTCPNFCVLRITNVYKAGSALGRPQGIIPLLFQASRAGSEVEIWGDGSATKDYIAASDLYRAVEAALLCDLRGIYNVSSGDSVSVSELIACVEEICGRQLRRRHLAEHPWDVKTSYVSSEKLRNAVSWSPFLPLRETLQRLAVSSG
jgi:nucleoside-diphosphate-sugar epimerase